MTNRQTSLLIIAIAVSSFVSLSQPFRCYGGVTLRPDIFSDFIEVNYNAATHVFTASGWAEKLHVYSGGPYSIVNSGTPNFQITATISPTGLASAGNLAILGTIPTLSSIPNSGVLLTGSLTAFTFVTNTKQLTFDFGNLSGDLASLYGLGWTARTALSLGDLAIANDFNNGFGDNFKSSMLGGTGVADTYATPEPTTLVVWSILLLGLIVVRHFRSAF